jgi:membrane-associated phospholipid phosphatase
VSPGPAFPVAAFELRAPLVWLVPLIALAGFAAVFLANQNQALFLALNRLGPLTSDEVWANVTVLGDTVVALALGLTLWRRRPDLIWALAIGALLASAWVHVLKPLVQVPRPPAVLGEQVHVIGPAHRKDSFPSGHSTTSFAVAGLLALGLAPSLSRHRRAASAASDGARHARTAAGPAARAWAAIAIALALLATVSRSVVGVHWPLDLLAGAFGGWLSAAFGLALARRTLRFGTTPLVQWIMGLLLTGCAVALVIGHRTGYPAAMPFQRILGLVCLGCALVTLWRTRVAAARIGPN